MGGEQRILFYLDFSKAFDSVSHNSLTGNPRKCGLDEGTVRQAENCLNGRSQRIVTSGTGSGWRPVTSGDPQVQKWSRYCVTSPSVTWMKVQVPPQQVHGWHRAGSSG